jgi:DNA-binding response OmpR family regulator
MPVMDGWEFRARQQHLRDQRLAEVPVVLLTAGTNAQSHAQALGARGVIRKPVAPETLLTTVARHAAPEAACLEGSRLSTPPLHLTLPTADRRKARILFVDDDPSALQSYAHALTADDA